MYNYTDHRWIYIYIIFIYFLGVYAWYDINIYCIYIFTFIYVDMYLHIICTFIYIYTSWIYFYIYLIQYLFILSPPIFLATPTSHLSCLHRLFATPVNPHDVTIKGMLWWRREFPPFVDLRIFHGHPPWGWMEWRRISVDKWGNPIFDPKKGKHFSNPEFHKWQEHACFL